MLRRLVLSIALTLLLTLSLAMYWVEGAYPPVLTEVIPKEPSIVDTIIGAWVAKVVDGSTLGIQTQSGVLNISIYGIETPKDGAWSRKAKEFVVWKVERKQVALEVMGRDRYGRASCRVYQAGSDVGLSLVGMGLAKTSAPTDEVMAITEKAAKARGIGMWGNTGRKR